METLLSGRLNKIKIMGFAILLSVFLCVEFKWGLFWVLVMAFGGTAVYCIFPSGCISKRTKSIISVISAVCAAAFICNLSSLAIAEKKGSDGVMEVEIEVLGEKNPDALGTEVWLVEIIGDFQDISLLAGEFDENWEYREPRLVSYNGSHAFYKGSFPVKSNIKICFAAGEYSGKARVDINGRQKILDLYSDDGGFPTVEYFYPVYKVSLFYAAAVFGLIYLLVEKLLLFAVYMQRDKENRKAAVRLYYAVIFGVGVILYWLAYYPGSMTADSIVQWLQMTGAEPLTTQHSVAYIMISWLITRIWFHPAAIAAVQIMAHIFVHCFIFAFYDERIGRRKVTVAACVTALYPLNNLTTITLWKDIPYSLALLEMTYILIRVVCYGESLKGRWHRAGFAACCAAVLLFRHNGILVVWAVFFALVIFEEQRKYFAQAVLAAVCFAMIFQGPVFKILGVQTENNQMKLGYGPLTDIGYLIHSGAAFTEEEQQFLDVILPADKWKESYKSYDVDSIYFHHDINKDFLMDNQNEFYKIWLKYGLKYPHYYLLSNMSRTSLVWNIFDVGSNKAVWAGGGIRKYCPEIFETSKLPYVRYAVNRFIVNGILKLPYLNFVFSRPALFMYLGFAIWWKLRKAKKNLWIIFMPNIFNILSIAVSTPSQEVRFLYANVLLFPLFLMLYLDRDGWSRS